MSSCVKHGEGRDVADETTDTTSSVWTKKRRGMSHKRTHSNGDSHIRKRSPFSQTIQHQPPPSPTYLKHCLKKISRR
eukprot:scaffold33443_cov89-Skeletonema_dohrnii-CCMP3373.AAC.1